jgi:hypothetical protein
LSERWTCRLVNQPRGTQRYQPTQHEDQDILTKAIVALDASTAATAIAGPRYCCSRMVPPYAPDREFTKLGLRATDQVSSPAVQQLPAGIYGCLT